MHLKSIAILTSKIETFSGEGHRPSPDLPPVGRVTPPPHTRPLVLGTPFVNRPLCTTHLPSRKGAQAELACAQVAPGFLQLTGSASNQLAIESSTVYHCTICTPEMASLSIARPLFFNSN